MIFTAAVLGAGFKGGEIVPTLCVGAAFGATAARLAGLDQALWAACAMAALFAGVTNCPIATVILAFEMFGYGAMPYFAIIVAVSFTLSGYYGLYKSQKFVYSKLKRSTSISGRSKAGREPPGQMEIRRFIAGGDYENHYFPGQKHAGGDGPF